MSIHPPRTVRTKCSALLTMAALLSAASMQGATIIQNDNNYIAFEAEIAAIDNSGGGSSTEGWEIDGANPDNMPANPSADSYVVNKDRTLNAAPTDTLTFDMDLINDGAYRPWFRVAYSDESTDSDGNFHDSWYFQSGVDGVDWTEDNNNPISTAAWNWHDGGVDVSFSSDGEATWAVSSREDWLIMDRIVLISADNTDTINAAYLDGLDNSSVIPEPATLAFLALAGLALLRRRQI